MLTRDEEVYYVRQRGTDKILQSGDLPYVTCSLAAAHFVVATLNDAIEQALDQWEIQPYTIPAPEPPPEPEIPPWPNGIPDGKICAWVIHLPPSAVTDASSLALL